MAKKKSSKPARGKPFVVPQPPPGHSLHPDSQSGESPVRQITSNDLGSRPAQAEFKRQLPASRRTIRVGAVQRTSHGTLRCERRGNSLVVSLIRSDGRPCPELVYRPREAAHLIDGAEIPESAFDTQTEEFVGTAWQELHFISVWTVSSLRERGEPALTAER